MRKRNLSTGIEEMDRFINNDQTTEGGLEIGKTSYWTSLIHNYRSGTIASLCYGAVVSNGRSEDGRKNGMLIIDAELNANLQYARWYIWLRALNGHREILDVVVHYDLEVLKSYVNNELALLGWDVRFMFPEPGNFDPLTIYDALDAMEMDGVCPRMVSADPLELLKSRDSSVFTLVEGLVKLHDSYDIHLALAHVLTPDAKAMHRDVANPTTFLKVAARTGYVPRKLDNLVDSQVVVHVIQRTPTPHVGYHHANGHFNRGQVDIPLGNDGLLTGVHPV